MKIKLILVIIVSVIILIPLIYFGIKFSQAMYIQIRYQNTIEQKLGFTLETPDINGQERIIFTNVKPDGIFSKAGVKNGDILIQKQIGPFLNAMRKSQNSIYSFQIQSADSIKTININPVPDLP